MIEDKLLIWRFKSGDSAALARIYEKYRNSLLRIAAALLNETSTAEDVVHDVFVGFAQSADQIKLSGNLKSYLATCVVNRARNVRLSTQRRQTANMHERESGTFEAESPARWIVVSEEFANLNKALPELPYEQREVVILHLQGGMKFKAIAKAQNVSINTVQSRYRYGLNKLRSLLDSDNEA